MLDPISPRIASAYTAGLSRAMLVLAGVCVLGAALLRIRRQAGQDE